MLTIKVPASSANLGCGFDSLGLALNLYNTFTFEKSVAFVLKGFESSIVEENLVCVAYNFVFEYLKKEVVPVKITLDETQIPISRGLGSSASCIVAGVYAANYFLDSVLSQDECLKIATMIEGHPDNVCACALGGLVSSFIKDDNVKAASYPVSQELSFFLAIPNFTLSTEAARKVMPEMFPLKDFVFTLSRAIQLPYAFAKGDIGLLKVLMDDKVHEPFRYPLIENALNIKNDFKDLEVAISISGAGSSLLLISHLPFSELNLVIQKYPDWNLVNVDVSHQGTQMIQSEV